MVFTHEQKRSMLEIYLRNGQKINGEWVYSNRDAFAEFSEEFPNVAVPYNVFCKTLRQVVKVYRETGSVSHKPGAGRPKVRTEENVELVRAVIVDQPHTSIRHLRQQTDLSYGTCQRILKKDLHFYPYRLQAFHELAVNDYPQRLGFCNWYLDNLSNNGDVLSKTFFTDECWFHLSGYTNSQNMRMWSADNPHYFVETPLYPQKLGVWAAISKRRIVGPIFFEGVLNAERYRQEILTPFINQLMDDELTEGYFQQDGARIHTTLQNLNYIMDFFDNRVISLNTPIIFPPRSCDLTPCDFFLWPYLKNLIFKTPVADLEDLKQRITNHIEELNNTPSILNNVIESMTRRVTLCRDVGGGHIQHLL